MVILYITYRTTFKAPIMFPDSFTDELAGPLLIRVGSFKSYKREP